MQECSLVFLYKVKEKKILLAMKKRRFGEGKWNGVGGKLESKETVYESAVRETKEEIGVDIAQKNLNQVATIDFFFKDNVAWNQRVIVFFVENWTGEPVETEEMKPEWYGIDKIPYDQMWIDDINWLPKVLNGEKLNATFNFNKSGTKILKMKIESI